MYMLREILYINIMSGNTLEDLNMYVIFWKPLHGYFYFFGSYVTQEQFNDSLDPFTSWHVHDNH